VELVFKLKGLCLQRAIHHLSHVSRPFFCGYFCDDGLMNYFPNWVRIVIFSISASQLASILGMSHKHQLFIFLINNLLYLKKNLTGSREDNFKVRKAVSTQ
jgi:hypothetical protein